MALLLDCVAGCARKAARSSSRDPDLLYSVTANGRVSVHYGVNVVYVSAFAELEARRLVHASPTAHTQYNTL